MQSNHRSNDEIYHQLPVVDKSRWGIVRLNPITHRWEDKGRFVCRSEAEDYVRSLNKLLGKEFWKVVFIPEPSNPIPLPLTPPPSASLN